LDEKSAQIVEADNEFGFELFQKIFASETKYENIMVSPFSVSLALAMTYNGAGGETKKAMEETLKLYGLSPEEINTSYQTLVKALKSLDKKVILEIANAIFYRDDFQVENGFISTNKNFYDAEVSALDFGSPNALKTINDWVANKTHDKIDKILDKISNDHIMFLINAIYFKGIWQSEFEKKNTAEKDFYLENGSTVKTDFMQQENSVLYSSNELFQAVQLPYGQGNYTMNIFLPQAGKSLQDITENLDKENWKNWNKNFVETNVDIELPKFKFEYELTMNQVLTDMGMGIAFTRGVADFTGINRGGNLNIDYVKHKSFIEVNEEGTEAAAVTVVAIEFTSVGGTTKVPFYVNRPFLFAITEKSTGAVLFMGTVRNPQVN
jgi:serpin B